jgi:hypothetical protein
MAEYGIGFRNLDSKYHFCVLAKGANKIRLMSMNYDEPYIAFHKRTGEKILIRGFIEGCMDEWSENNNIELMLRNRDAYFAEMDKFYKNKEEKLKSSPVTGYTIICISHDFGEKYDMKMSYRYTLEEILEVLERFKID